MKKRSVIVEGIVPQTVVLRVFLEEGDNPELDFLTRLRDGHFEVVETMKPHYSMMEWNGDEPVLEEN